MSIAITRTGHEILTFVPCDEPTVPENDATVPITFSVVVVRHDGRYLLLYNSGRQQWEIPGGGREDGEHPDDTARREVQEETGQIVRQLQCRGVFKIRLKPDDTDEYGALYSGTLDAVLPFTSNEESERITLWNHGEELDGFLSVFSQVMIDLLANR